MSFSKNNILKCNRLLLRFFLERGIDHCYVNHELVVFGAAIFLYNTSGDARACGTYLKSNYLKITGLHRITTKTIINRFNMVKTSNTPVNSSNCVLLLKS